MKLMPPLKKIQKACVQSFQAGAHVEVLGERHSRGTQGRHAPFLIPCPIWFLVSELS